MHLQAFDGQVGAVGGHAGIDVQDLVEIDAELVLALAGGDLGVRMRIDIGIHTNGHGRLHAKLTGHLVDVVQLRLGLGVEAVDALLESVLDFVAGFTNAGEGAFRGIATSLDDAVEFASRDDVKAAAELGDGVEHSDIRIRLHCKADQVVQFGQRSVQTRVMTGDGALGINIERRAVLLGEGLKRDVFGK